MEGVTQLCTKEVPLDAEDLATLNRVLSDPHWRGFGSGITPEFQRLLSVLQTEPPGRAIEWVAAQDGVGLALKLLLCPSVLQSLSPEGMRHMFGRTDAWCMVRGLLSIIDAANQDKVTLANRATFVEAWESALACLADPCFWGGEPADDGDRKMLCLLVLHVVHHLQHVPQQVLIDSDRWAECVGRIEDEETRSFLSGIMRRTVQLYTRQVLGSASASVDSK